MKNIDIEKRFDEVFAPLKEVGKKHEEMAEKLCNKIDCSNGQIYRAFYGMASNGISALPIRFKDEQF